MSYNYHEYVVPKSIPITVPSSSFDFEPSLDAMGLIKNNSAQKAQMDFRWSMPRFLSLKKKTVKYCYYPLFKTTLILLLEEYREVFQ